MKCWLASTSQVYHDHAIIMHYTCEKCSHSITVGIYLDTNHCRLRGHKSVWSIRCPMCEILIPLCGTKSIERYSRLIQKLKESQCPSSSP